VHERGDALGERDASCRGAALTGRLHDDRRKAFTDVEYAAYIWHPASWWRRPWLTKRRTRDDLALAGNRPTGYWLMSRGSRGVLRVQTTQVIRTARQLRHQRARGSVPRLVHRGAHRGYHAGICDYRRAQRSSPLCMEGHARAVGASQRTASRSADGERRRDPHQRDSGVTPTPVVSWRS